MEFRNALCGLLIVFGVAGCSGGGSSGEIQLGPASGSPQAQTNSSSSTSGQTAAVESYGVRFVPPAWFTLDDHPALAAAASEYILDAQTQLSGWLPQPGDAVRHPLTVILHDVQGSEYWSETTRTAWLSWPRGSTGKPVRTVFMPLLHTVLVLDRRRELGTSQTAFTTQESDVSTRGRTLQITLNTLTPWLYD